jgi:hypothetical protein
MMTARLPRNSPRKPQSLSPFHSPQPWATPVGPQHAVPQFASSQMHRPDLRAQVYCRTVRLTPLEATLTRCFANVANKGLALELSSLDATLTKFLGVAS